MTLRGKGR